jgi:hypothetical protein
MVLASVRYVLLWCTSISTTHSLITDIGRNGHPPPHRYSLIKRVYYIFIEKF